MAESRKKLTKKTFMALYEMEQKGIKPIDMLLEVYNESMAAYKSGRGYSEKGDAGPSYLAQALGAAKQLAGFKYPSLSAVAVKDMSELDSSSKPMTTKEAIEIIKKDPFAPPEIKKLDTSLLPEQEIDILPMGKPNDPK